MTNSSNGGPGEDRRRISHETRLERESEATAEEDRGRMGEKKWDGMLVRMEEWRWVEDGN
jgi:hypothetical protein